MMVANSRKKCPVTFSEDPLFVSLVDYRNNYFMSDNLNKILEFYNGFDNREQLIKWMKERPKGVANIHEVEGEKNIIVVIPTADFNGKYARECRDNIFKGLHMIFVESGEIPDPYFNFAHNCNVGIKKAIEYNPEWVVVSNDDMYQIDDVNILTKELYNIDHVSTMAVFTKPSKYHSYQVCVGEKRKIVFSVVSFLYGLRHFHDKNFRMENGIKRRFEINWTRGPDNFLISKLLLRNSRRFLLSGDFLILSGYFVQLREGEVFDESYINGWDDLDLSFRIIIENLNCSTIDFKIGDLVGSTLSPTSEETWNRLLRDIANNVYLDYKISIDFILWK